MKWCPKMILNLIWNGRTEHDDPLKIVFRQTGESKRRILFLLYFLEITLSISWINILRDTQANYIIYLICEGGAVCSLGIRMNRLKDEKESAYIGVCGGGDLILAGIFATFIVLGNYEIIEKVAGLHRWVSVFMLFCTSVIIFYNIFEVLYIVFINFKSVNTCLAVNKEKIFFSIIPFIIFMGIDFIYLFGAVYPGVLTLDSMDQLTQIQNGIYSNHHPFYHTMLIKFFYLIGLNLFNDLNAAVATYLVFQILLLALTFSYVVLTIYEISKSKIAVSFVILYYILMPYHWNYSCTMWKDITFGIACTVFVVSLYRARKKMGSEKVNLILLFVSAVGICLLRSNGIFVYSIVMISLIIAFRNKVRIPLQVILAAFIVALVMKGPVLNIMNVKNPDATEALSIPAQQIARVISNGQYIGDSDMELLKKIMNVNAVKEEYVPYISDPVKRLICQSDGTNVLLNNKAEYLSLWIRLGLQYPGTYIAAWVEQTKGYWNAGYDYWYCTTNIIDNELGVYQTIKSERLAEVTEKIIMNFRTNSFLCSFVSIGFCFWIYLVLCWFNILSKRDGWIETIPAIAIIVSLCVATPVFNEFRYSYGLYLSVPFVIFSACYSKCL